MTILWIYWQNISRGLYRNYLEFVSMHQPSDQVSIAYQSLDKHWTVNTHLKRKKPRNWSKTIPNYIVCKIQQHKFNFWGNNIWIPIVYNNTLGLGGRNVLLFCWLSLSSSEMKSCILLMDTNASPTMLIALWKNSVIDNCTTLYRDRQRNAFSGLIIYKYIILFYFSKKSL